MRLMGQQCNNRVNEKSASVQEDGMKIMAWLICFFILLLYPFLAVAAQTYEPEHLQPAGTEEKLAETMTVMADNISGGGFIVQDAVGMAPVTGLTDNVTGYKEQPADAPVIVAGFFSRPGEPVKEDTGKRNGNDAVEDGEADSIADPLYPWNKLMYHFNDRFYFWMLKPLSQGYKAVAPEVVRIGVSNFFQNLTTPVRFVSNILQLRIDRAGREFVRFIVNSTIGVAGFMDIAKTRHDLTMQEADIGQTLGRYGIGHGIYLVWPFIGPSSLRDTVGLAGDHLLNPVSYINPLETSIGITAYDEVNETSFYIGDYEAIKKAAIDPYVSFRNAYIQHRKKIVRE
jgi:phospholipid-binding lipoprotein MlaA